MNRLKNVSETGAVIPFNPFDPTNREFMKDLQGNILKGHGRNKAMLFFLKFNEKEIPLVKARIRELSKEITSFQLQVEESKLFRSHQIPGSTFVNFFLTAKGYAALGYDNKTLGNNGFDVHFRNGMSIDFMKNELNDPHPKDNWDPQYWDKEHKEIKEIHALLLVADNDEGNLGISTGRLFKEVLDIKSEKDIVEIVAVERADQLRNEYDQAVEHFGFRDGLSNPLFLQSDQEKIEEYGGQTLWNPRAPLGLVLSKDPFGKNGENSCGSYLVYRKYEQHVKKFETHIRNLAMDLGLDSQSEDDLEKTRARVMGRFRDGTPLAVQDETKRYYYENLNNFNYGKDPSGSECPFHAHIRNVNPRTQAENSPRLVRRGMTYGKRINYQSQKLSALPNQDVGLLFMSFQENIREQFVALQQSFANNPDFPKKATGRDSIIGQAACVPCNSCQGSEYLKETEICPECLGTGETIPLEPHKKWPLGWGTPKCTFSNEMQNCITLKGGEFFFAPSISFLRSLSGENQESGESNENLQGGQKVRAGVRPLTPVDKGKTEAGKK